MNNINFSLTNIDNNDVLQDIENIYESKYNNINIVI